MKNKEIKYQEAVERNLAYAKKNPNPDWPITVDGIARKIGIRYDDARWLPQVKAIQAQIKRLKK